MKAAGMAGEQDIQDIAAFLSQLTGADVLSEQPVQLRSVHRAAFLSWSRKRGLPIRSQLLTSPHPFRVRDLVGGDDAEVAAIPSKLPRDQSLFPRAGSSGNVAGIGIDIEEADNLPRASDYREHPFFERNFTPAEISYCIRQPDPRAAFCGLWAAKEAVLKSGAIAMSTPLNAVEIGHDDTGMPTRPGGMLSISHTAHTAIAVFIASAGVSAAAAAPAALQPPLPVPALTPAPRRKSYEIAAIAGAAGIVVGGAVSLVLRSWAW